MAVPVSPCGGGGHQQLLPVLQAFLLRPSQEEQGRVQVHGGRKGREPQVPDPGLAALSPPCPCCPGTRAEGPTLPRRPLEKATRLRLSLANRVMSQ